MGYVSLPEGICILLVQDFLELIGGSIFSLTKKNKNLAAHRHQGFFRVNQPES